MLRHSFIHVPSIGMTTERRIWNSGIRSIDDFIDAPPAFISATQSQRIASHLHLARNRIVRGDAGYFYDNLSSKDHWRMFKEFRHSIAYLDIETTGLGSPGDIITTIALYDGKEIKYYVNGQNLACFVDDVMQYDVIVTYNGKTFDIPFIENYFRIRMPHAHLDLRYILRSIGFSGGLKSCERQLGIGRRGSLADVDGFFAVLLWYDYTRGKNIKSLETLLSYNIQDVLNLEYLMIEAYNRKLTDIPLSIDGLSAPAPPDNPFAIDAQTVHRLGARFPVREPFGPAMRPLPGRFPV